MFLYLIYNKMQKVLSYLYYENFIFMLISFRRYYLLQMILTKSSLSMYDITFESIYISLHTIYLYMYNICYIYFFKSLHLSCTENLNYHLNYYLKLCL